MQEPPLVRGSRAPRRAGGGGHTEGGAQASGLWGGALWDRTQAHSPAKGYSSWRPPASGPGGWGRRLARRIG
eukprot:7065338-Pyramimonas_sp.AAC.1